MPTYQYRCAKCGEQFDLWQSIHDNALTVHDGDCGGDLSKVMAVGGIVLKGPGFYRTDNRSKAGGQEQERKREGDSSSKSDSSKSDTSSGNGSGDSKKSDSGSKSETSTSGASKSDSSKS